MSEPSLGSLARGNARGGAFYDPFYWCPSGSGSPQGSAKRREKVVMDDFSIYSHVHLNSASMFSLHKTPAASNDSATQEKKASCS
ncbi:hypothetical protein AMTR_s00057p00220380 [Amborella trichopoda]|uniref:Uncharacterized protein n=1 Tax=Amborella trichopoda TaxID=13333 RepID=U5CUR0_AMBTC|nr:hypothetical protein AMTR_s00057p00220380 [Amborella trichopoda]